MAHNRLLPNEIPDAAPARAPRFSFDPVTHGFAVGYMTTPATRACINHACCAGNHQARINSEGPRGKPNSLNCSHVVLGTCRWNTFDGRYRIVRSKKA